MPKPGGNQKHQTYDDPEHNAQEHEKVIEWTQAKNGIVRVEKHPSANTENDGKDASRNLRIKTAHMGLIPRDIPWQWRRILLEHGQRWARTISRWYHAHVLRLIGVPLRTRRIPTRLRHIADDKVIKRDIEQVTDHEQLVHLRVSLLAFPLADGLAGDTQKHRQLLLSHVALCPQILQVGLEIAHHPILVYDSLPSEEGDGPTMQHNKTFRPSSSGCITETQPRFGAQPVVASASFQRFDTTSTRSPVRPPFHDVGA